MLKKDYHQFCCPLPISSHRHSKPIQWLTINTTLPGLLLTSLNNTRTELNTQMSLLIFSFTIGPTLSINSSLRFEIATGVGRALWQAATGFVVDLFRFSAFWHCTCVFAHQWRLVCHTTHNKLVTKRSYKDTTLQQIYSYSINVFFSVNKH